MIPPLPAPSVLRHTDEGSKVARPSQQTIHQLRHIPHQTQQPLDVPTMKSRDCPILSPSTRMLLENIPPYPRLKMMLSDPDDWLQAFFIDRNIEILLFKVTVWFKIVLYIV